jgi:hypothetical protein
MESVVSTELSARETTFGMSTAVGAGPDSWSRAYGFPGSKCGPAVSKFGGIAHARWYEGS